MLKSLQGNNFQISQAISIQNTDDEMQVITEYFKPIKSFKEYIDADNDLDVFEIKEVCNDSMSFNILSEN